MGKGDVAGILQRLGRLFRPVSRGAPAVKFLGTPRNLLGAGAVEGGIQIDGAAVQRRRHGQHLEGGTRLIAVGDHPVAPLLQSGGGEGFPVGRLPRLVGFASLRLRKVRPFHFFQLRRRSLVGDFQIVVGVIAAQRGHGEDFSRLAVHHQPKRAVLDIVAGDGGGKLFFQARLHRGVQRQDHAVSLPGGNVVFIGKGHIHFVIALGGDDSARAA